MDSALFVPLFDALLQIVSAVDAQWAAIVGLVLLLLRTGAIKFPFKIPFLKPKVDPAVPVDPSKPVDPAAPPALPTDPKDILADLIRRLRERFNKRQALAVEREAKILLAQLEDDKLPLAEETK